MCFQLLCNFCVEMIITAKMENIKEMYLFDKQETESNKKKIYIDYHRPEFDILDNCYNYNQRLLMEDLPEKNRLYLNLQRQINSIRKNVVCAHIGISFTTIIDWIDCRASDRPFAKLCAIENVSVHRYEPLSLQNIAAAASVKILNNVKSCDLFAIFNVLKGKNILIRCGPDHERMIYNFDNIIKNFIYKNKFNSLVPAKYFENVAMDPIPFCIHCGIFKKIQNSMCWCGLCNFLRFACVFTKKIERFCHIYVN